MKKIFMVVPFLAAMFFAVSCSSDSDDVVGVSADVSLGGTYEKTVSLDLTNSALKANAFTVEEDITNLISMNVHYAVSRATEEPEAPDEPAFGLSAKVTSVTTTNLGVKIKFVAPTTDSIVNIAVYIPAGKTVGNKEAIIHIGKITVGGRASAAVSEASIDVKKLSHPTSSELNGSILRSRFLTDCDKNEVINFLGELDNDKGKEIVNQFDIIGSCTEYEKITSEETKIKDATYHFYTVTFSRNGISKTVTVLSKDGVDDVTYNESSGSFKREDKNADEPNETFFVKCSDSEYLEYRDTATGKMTRKSGNGLFAKWEYIVANGGTVSESLTATLDFDSNGIISGTANHYGEISPVTGFFNSSDGIVLITADYPSKNGDGSYSIGTLLQNFSHVYTGTELLQCTSYTKVNGFPEANFTNWDDVLPFLKKTFFK